MPEDSVLIVHFSSRVASKIGETIIDAATMNRRKLRPLFMEYFEYKLVAVTVPVPFPGFLLQ